MKSNSISGLKWPVQFVLNAMKNVDKKQSQIENLNTEIDQLSDRIDGFKKTIVKILINKDRADLLVPDWEKLSEELEIEEREENIHHAVDSIRFVGISIDEVVAIGNRISKSQKGE